MQTLQIKMLVASLSLVALSACQLGGTQAGAAGAAGADTQTTNAAAAPVGASDPVSAAQLCPRVNGVQEISAELLFGRNVKGRRPVTDKEVRQFLADVVTPRFPDGFTTWRTQGQWLDKDKNHVTKEESFVIQIVASGTQDTLDHISEVRSAYINQFHQESVGLVLTDACASF
ncbi:DUF3574 domain-containing protein [Paraburkholderia megapolitana]|uniref:DUF3574 domain-containing protein n=1 Tax=Paraburkholderia megapolitana TaxID=420953 RepID=UPI0038B894F7